MEKNIHNLDELDSKLVQELEQNARVSYAALASKIGTSPPTVRRRIDKLVDSGVVMIGTMLNYVALGFRSLVVLGINAAPGTMNALARQLASINRIKYICITAGRYDLLALALYHSPEEYMRSFPGEIGCVLGSGRVEVMLSTKTIKRSWALLTHTNLGNFSSYSNFTPTALDLSVIRRLEEFPRASAKEIARSIGASFSSVRFSLYKIFEQDIVRILCIPDPTAFGYAANGITLIHANPSSLNTLTEELKMQPPVKLVALTFGAFDCMIWTNFQNPPQMSDFLAKDLGNMPGVIHYENLVALKTHKRSFTLFSEDKDIVDVHG